MTATPQLPQGMSHCLLNLYYFLHYDAAFYFYSEFGTTYYFLGLMIKNFQSKSKNPKS